MEFHHLGVACRDLGEEAQTFAAIGYGPDGDGFVDERQGVRGRFLVGPGPRLELLVALPGSTVLDPWLDKGVKFFHQGFVVEELSEALEGLREGGGRVLSAPAPAVAFDGREIAFVMLRNLAMVELIQSAPAADG
jgi:methylmalonyl-CoA/ethylmalonyl-CoA epimerase